MRCPSCHHDNRSDRRFCTQCGTKLVVGCSSCGAPIEVGEKFCGGCGAAVTIDAWTTTPSPAHAPVLAEKIPEAKATVEGERKQVTVLFADVKGSMELAEQLDPEAWSQIMQRFFRIFCDGIERFEGFVDKFTGDGGMAFYDIRDDDSPEATRAKIAGRLLLMNESFREMLPFVFDLLGVPDPGNPSPAIEPEQRQKRIHGAAINPCRIFGNFRKVGILSSTDSNFFNRLRLVSVLH